MATLGRSNNGSIQNTSRRSYITTDNYQEFFFRYSTRMANSRYTGTLTPITTDRTLTPAGKILKETGRKLIPGANPNIENYMVSVYDEVTFMTGFIDPNARVFAIYNTDKPNFLPNDINNTINQYGGLYGPPILTAGNILQISTDISGFVSPSYMGVLDNLSTTKYALMYQWYIGNNMFIEATDMLTNTSAYLSSEGNVIATSGIGYSHRTVDTQYISTTSDVFSSSNSPTGIIQMSATSVGIPAYQTTSFQLFNSTIGTNDYLSVQYAGGLTFPGKFNYAAQCIAPSTGVVTIMNTTPEIQYPSSFSLQYILLKTSDSTPHG